MKLRSLVVLGLAGLVISNIAFATLPMDRSKLLTRAQRAEKEEREKAAKEKAENSSANSSSSSSSKSSSSSSANSSASAGSSGSSTSSFTSSARHSTASSRRPEYFTEYGESHDFLVSEVLPDEIPLSLVREYASEPFLVLLEQMAHLSPESYQSVCGAGGAPVVFQDVIPIYYPLYYRMSKEVVLKHLGMGAKRAPKHNSLEFDPSSTAPIHYYFRVAPFLADMENAPADIFPLHLVQLIRGFAGEVSMPMERANLYRMVNAAQAKHRVDGKKPNIPVWNEARSALARLQMKKETERRGAVENKASKPEGFEEYQLAMQILRGKNLSSRDLELAKLHLRLAATKGSEPAKFKLANLSWIEKQRELNLRKMKRMPKTNSNYPAAAQAAEEAADLQGPTDREWGWEEADDKAPAAADTTAAETSDSGQDAGWDDDSEVEERDTTSSGSSSSSSSSVQLTKHQDVKKRK